MSDPTARFKLLVADCKAEIKREKQVSALLRKDVMQLKKELADVQARYAAVLETYWAQKAKTGKGKAREKVKLGSMQS